MKCVECADYAECSKKHNLTIKRKHCPVAKVEYVQTKADRIRAMSDEELANIVVCPHVKTNWDKCIDDCFACRLEWLKQPAEEGDGNG